MNERLGCIEIRWNDDDPDDVVAPWPQELDGDPVQVHVERMSDGHVWMEIRDDKRDLSVCMWFRAVKKGDLLWTVGERRGISDRSDAA